MYKIVIDDVIGDTTYSSYTQAYNAYINMNIEGIDKIELLNLDSLMSRLVFLNE